MDFFAVCQSRHSVRSFKEAAIPANLLDQILEAVATCPTAGNLKAYRVIVVSEAHKKEALREASLGQKSIAEAALVLAFLALPEKSAKRYGERGAHLYALQDATIACTFATLATKAVGLDSVWIGAFEPNKVQEVLGVPAYELPIALLPIGYAK